MKKVPLALILLAGCGAEGLPNGTLELAPSDARAFLQRGYEEAPSNAAGGRHGSSALVDHGGRILPASKVYAIWWGNQASFPADAQSGIDSLLSGWNGTTFLGVAQQYMRGASVSSAYVASNWIDSSSPPNVGPSTSPLN